MKTDLVVKRYNLLLHRRRRWLIHLRRARLQLYEINRKLQKYERLYPARIAAARIHSMLTHHNRKENP